MSPTRVRSPAQSASTARPSVAARARKSAPRSQNERALSRVEAAWRRYARGRSAVSRNALVELYQGFLADVLRRFSLRLPRIVDPGDLETAANVGLIAAIESFDPRRGVAFEGYCELRVRGALLDELRAQDWMPRPWRARIERQKRAIEGLRASLQREPDDTEVAARLGMGLGEYVALFGGARPSAPGGSAPSWVESSASSLLDVVPDSRVDAMVDRLTREDLLALVNEHMTAQECRIVYLKYWEELPLREIGELEGLSESRVCKIHLRLLERLHERLAAIEPP